MWAMTTWKRWWDLVWLELFFYCHRLLLYHSWFWVMVSNYWGRSWDFQWDVICLKGSIDSIDLFKRFNRFHLVIRFHYIMELCAISGARCIRKMSSWCSMRTWSRRWPPLKIRDHLDQPGDEPMGFWLRNEIGMLEWGRCAYTMNGWITYNWLHQSITSMIN